LGFAYGQDSQYWGLVLSDLEDSRESLDYVWRGSCPGRSACGHLGDLSNRISSMFECGSAIVGQRSCAAIRTHLMRTLAGQSLWRAWLHILPAEHDSGPRGLPLIEGSHR